ncbi:MAG: glycoside hydrolase family 18 protein [Tepidisphaeraceae bacterium]
MGELLLVTAIALIVTHEIARAESFRVVGYYAEWEQQFPVERIPAERLTHVNYAFAIIKEGKCAMRNAELAPANFKKLSELKKKRPQLQTLISVGGWADSELFSDVALTDESRQTFAKSCADFAAEHQLDGVDIDWEFPVSGGEKGNIARPQDKRNFTLLLAELRKALDARGKADGKRYLLTIAAPAGGYARIEMGQFHRHLDFVNVMAYDFAGDWSPRTGFNAALHPVPGHPDQPSASAAVEAYLKAGVPPDKIVLGVPFYGRGWAGVNPEDNGLFQPRDPPDAASAKGKRVGPANYRELKNDRDGQAGKRFWHEQAKVPWMWNPQTRVFISYDDPESLRLKARYARDNKLGGVMFWELSHDDEESSLLNALHEGLRY